MDAPRHNGVALLSELSFVLVFFLALSLDTRPALAQPADTPPDAAGAEAHAKLRAIPSPNAKSCTCR